MELRSRYSPSWRDSAEADKGEALSASKPGDSVMYMVSAVAAIVGVV